MSRRLPKKEYDGKTPLPDVKQELFCELFSTNTLPAFWGNGQNCYSFAYGHYKRIDALVALITGPARTHRGKSKPALEAEKKKIERLCAASAARLLVHASIKLRCDHLLDKLAAHSIVDRELLYVIQQRRDLDSKVAAIKHHDQREARIRERIDIKHDFKPIKTITIIAPVEK